MLGEEFAVVLVEETGGRTTCAKLKFGRGSGCCCVVGEQTQTTTEGEQTHGLAGALKAPG